MDALRVSDGQMVMIKKIRVPDPTNPTRELQMGRLIHSGRLSVEDPDNHCVPIYDILQLPEDSYVYFIVMPFLTRWWPDWHEVPFNTLGEAISFMRQLFKVGFRLVMRHHFSDLRYTIERSIPPQPSHRSQVSFLYFCTFSSFLS